MEIRPDVAAVERILTRQFPELEPVHASYLGAGMDSVAFDVNDTWIFRFPMRAEVERQLFVERALLPVIAPHLPVAIPIFQFDGRPDVEFPMHFAGYEKIEGVPAVERPATQENFDVLAPQIGGFLSALHRFAVPEARRLGAQTNRMEGYFDDVRSSAVAGLEGVRQAAPKDVAKRVSGYLRTVKPLPDAPWPLTMTHYDLAAEHVLLDSTGTRVTGVIDWSDAAIADPSIDFVGLYTWGGERFVRSVLANYSGVVDTRVLDRVRPWGAFRAIQDIQFGLDHNVPDVVEYAVNALTNNIAS